MSSDQQIERSMLDGKDREQLHTIAGAVGVKGATRMRKADLIEAILATANAANSSPSTESAAAESAKPRRVRSARASELVDDSLAALAEEENALGGAADDSDVLPAPRPVRAPRTTTPTATVATAERASRPPSTDAVRETSNGGSPDREAYSSGR